MLEHLRHLVMHVWWCVCLMAVGGLIIMIKLQVFESRHILSNLLA